MGSAGKDLNVNLAPRVGDETTSLQAPVLTRRKRVASTERTCEYAGSDRLPPLPSPSPSQRVLLTSILGARNSKSCAYIRSIPQRRHPFDTTCTSLQASQVHTDHGPAHDVIATRRCSPREPHRPGQPHWEGLHHSVSPSSSRVAMDSEGAWVQYRGQCNLRNGLQGHGCTPKA